MTIFPQRERVIGIRISEKEHVAMKKYCLRKGIRSIADLARKAIKAYMDSVEQMPSSDKERNLHIKRLEQQIKELRTAMDTLMRTQQIDMREAAGKDK